MEETCEMQFFGMVLLTYIGVACRSSSHAHTAAGFRQHTSSHLRTRLPMSAYATPQHARQPLTKPKENWQEERTSTKSGVQSPRADAAHPLHDSN